MISIVKYGSIFDDQTFSEQLRDSFPNYIVVVLGTVYLLHRGQGFADDISLLSVNQLERGFDMQ